MQMRVGELCHYDYNFFLLFQIRFWIIKRAWLFVISALFTIIRKHRHPAQVIKAAPRERGYYKGKRHVYNFK